ncbi:MAG: hypothetical protein BM485_05905 [Desulfobulbaceae bacterium DB1]|nr:MAG: hypothetical protein BM485_05905 [Desulfobulbaceae bacterium DB1]
MRKKYTLPIAFLFWAGTSALAHADHIHFEDFYGTDVALSATGAISSTTWTFDLNNDPMALWLLADSEVHNLGADYFTTDSSYLGTGSMDAEDILHYAYLTFHFTGVLGDQGAEDEITILFDLDSMLELDANFKEPVDGDTSFFTWDGVSISDELIGDGANRINVWSYLEDDHYLTIKLTAVDGSFTVDWTNLSGCFEDAAPVPEPASMLLFGSGLAGLAGVLRRKVIRA